MKVRKGKHGFKPYRLTLRRKPELLASGVIFGEAAKYKLPYPDQADWNKGAGIAYRLLTNHKRSVMWAWRYNPFANSFEFTGYVHGKSGAVVKEDKNFFSAAPGEPVGITVMVNPDHVTFMFQGTLEGKTIVLPIDFKPGRLGRGIGAWFGGNNPAPKNLSFELYQNIIK